MKARILNLPVLLLPPSTRLCTNKRSASVSCNKSRRLVASIRMASSTKALNDSDSIVQDKKILRKEIRGRLHSLSNEEIKRQSEQVWDHLFSLEAYQMAKSVGLFLSMPSGEIETDVALQDAIEKNKVVYVPQVGRDFEKADMELIKVVVPEEFKSGTFHRSWPRNKWGIPEPPPSMPLEAAKQGDIDLIVVPGLAFDHSGNRLGQGKGYYDRFIARMTASGESGSDNMKIPLLVAVGLDCQFVSDRDIPIHEYDHPMDMIILPSRIIIPQKQDSTI